MSDNPPVEPADQFYTTSTEAEPIKPTEEADVTAEIQAPSQDEETLGTPEKSEELEASGDEGATQYIELDGKEISLDDVRTWQSGHMMQSDYTKKTQTLADDRKTFETERDSGRENLLQSQSKVSEMKDLLTVLVAEDEGTNWAELKEDDPDRYIELKEQADKRREALDKVKVSRETPADDPALIQAEQGKLFAANPEWFDEEGKPTETYTKDTTLLNDYAVKAGFTTEEFSRMTRSHHMLTILKAAKYDALQEKGREIKGQREKVPVVTKPTATKATSTPKPAHEVFYGS